MTATLSRAAARDYTRALNNLYDTVAAWLAGRGSIDGVRSAHALAKQARETASHEAFRTPGGSDLHGSAAVGGGGGTPLLPPSTETEFARQAPTTKRPAEHSEAERRESWLTPYGDAWTTAYGGKPPWGAMARELIEFHRQGREECLRRWKNYLAGTPGRFASAARFAQTYGEHDVARDKHGNTDPLDQLAGEDLDAYTARLARMTSR